MILNYDHYRPGKRRRRFRATVIPIAAVTLAAAVALFFILRVPERLFPAGGARQARGRLPDLWKTESYAGVISAADEILASDPLNPAALSYKGFASFYLAVAEGGGEERVPYLDEAIVALRRARLAGTPFAGETDYVLAKSYFQKGKFYYDLAIRYMESAQARGYSPRDAEEYVGLAATQLGDYEKGIASFLKALEAGESDVLLLTIGQTYYQMKQTGDAVDYLLRTLNKTDDAAIEKRARFLLGEIYLDRKELFRAEEQYAAIVKLDPQSADAHFFLGEVAAGMNDPIRARAEWRAALVIDPSHYGAKLRYYTGKR
jgi:tetratricopeptide (TPR) repeat protein